jgi:predicted esterase
MTRAAALLILSSACSATAPPDPRTVEESPPPPSAPGESSPAAPEAKAQEAEQGPRALDVPGFGAAVVVLPALSSRPAPLLVAAHGAGDAPEWQCEHWGSVARGRYFVLCPRGRSLGAGGGFYYANHLELERELVAALDAMRREHGALVRAGGGVYTGYSQGATMGALMVVEHGAEFSHLVLVEGGWGDWTLARAKRYAATGGRSVALVCGGSGCMQRAESAAAVLTRAGLRARAEVAPGGGHTYVGSVGERATDLFEHWLFREEG